MAATTIVFDSLNLGAGDYRINYPVDFGSAAIGDAIFHGDLRPEEYDAYLMQQGILRTVVISMTIRAANKDTMLSDLQAIQSKLNVATWWNTKDLVVTPNGASDVSTMKVIGGNIQTQMDHLSDVSSKPWVVILTLYCKPFIYGAAQALGSSGSPLTTNAGSPATATLTPTSGKEGDVPADITLSVKLRGAGLTARSLLAAAVTENTTWVPSVDSASWTLDSGSTNAGVTGALGTSTIGYDAPAINTIYEVAHFTVPTLPTDRRFRIILRARDNSTSPNRGNNQFRLRIVCGQVESVGQWVSIPDDATSTTFVGADMGAWAFPLGSFSSTGTSSSTVDVEILTLNTAASSMEFDYALFVPEDSTMVCETTDTTLALTTTGGTLTVESDVVFVSGLIPVGSLTLGSHIRAKGPTKFVVVLAQGYMAALDATGWDLQPVDIWAAYTPRYIDLA